MSSSRVLACTASAALRTHVSAFCRARQLLPVGQSNVFCPPKAARAYLRLEKAGQTDVKTQRARLDTQARRKFFGITREQKVLLLEVDVAEAIYQEFIANKDRKQYGAIIEQLMKKYNVTSEQISGLALVIFSVSDRAPAAANFPPSPHKSNAALLLQGCAQLNDPLALKHLLTAVYLSTYTASPRSSAHTLASHVPRAAIPTYRTALASLTLAGQTDPEALTLTGLFLEREAQPARARTCYERALAQPWIFAHAPHARHPMQHPVVPPWLALGYLLSASPDAAARAQATAVFERGAREADDPLACYEFAARLPRDSAAWLRFMSKAAASGHGGAMLALARFYRGVAAGEVQTGALRGALAWLLRWRKGAAERLAAEWYVVAGRRGQEGAEEELAEWRGTGAGKVGGRAA
ncbi:hypothetical protein C7974DRAFT_312183 [Boeremia exigua]|uniref:uncharacterized protein n=1 Tax=Boeremia exigua TaxID=749465 RepID=UPI001E8ECB6A|nr:uncharacterized protein C7974DRAFT_312183 [Boeremia exigua]KAH6625563.1 hypothetical protein C7974DRAFT_312183 [Boeremia exigua]